VAGQHCCKYYCEYFGGCCSWEYGGGEQARRCARTVVGVSGQNGKKMGERWQ